MRQIFVDTSAREAIADGRDPNHEVALLFRDEIAGQCRLVVTNYILDELYTLLLMNVRYQRAVDFKRKLDVLVQEGILEVIWVSEGEVVGIPSTGSVQGSRFSPASPSRRRATPRSTAGWGRCWRRCPEPAEGWAPASTPN